MNPTKKETMRSLLIQLEAELQAHHLWDNEKPESVKVLKSQMPFAVDVLSPEQWLQWVFLPKMHDLIQSNQALPSNYALLPYFEETLKECPSEKLLNLISQIDQLGQKSED